MNLQKLTVLLVMLLGTPLTLSADDLADFKNGRTNTFITGNHPKSDGLDMGIRYPATWATWEAQEPAIIQTLISDGGLGSDVVMLIAKEMEATPTGESLNAFFHHNNLQRMIPHNAQMLDVSTTEIDGLPAGLLEFVSSAEESGTGAPTAALIAIFIQGSKMVHVQFYSTAEAGASIESAVKRYSGRKNLYLRMIESIELSGSTAESPASE